MLQREPRTSSIEEIYVSLTDWGQSCRYEGPKLIFQMVNDFQELFPRIDPLQNPERWKGHPVTIFNHPWERGKILKKGAVSWTSAPITYHIYEVNRTKSLISESPPKPECLRPKLIPKLENFVEECKSSCK